VPGVPPDPEAARRHRKPFNTTADGRLYRLRVRLRVAAAGQPQLHAWITVQLDSGADCCLFAQHVADLLVIPRPADAHEERLRTGARLVVAWFAEVDLHLGYPTDPYTFDWTAPVGFVRDDILPAAFPSGILGVGGGLERFLSTTLILAPDGAEMPVVRLVTLAP
jgi:hypothetical protein